MITKYLLLLVLVCWSVTVRSAPLDSDSQPNTELDQLVTVIEAAGFAVARDLNARDTLRTRLAQPRLGVPANLAGQPADSAELATWESALAAAETGIILLTGAAATNYRAVADASEDYATFWQQWLQAEPQKRIAIVYLAADAQSAEQLFSGLHRVREALHVMPGAVPAGSTDALGRFYATAAQRWVIDSGVARRYPGELAEFAFLGRAYSPDRKLGTARRRAEPEIFLKETLGDEFEASTIPEIIVPGGIAFGEKAVLDREGVRLRFDGEQLELEAGNGSRWRMPAEEAATLRASLDFALQAHRLESHAAVDMDERGRIRISPALRDTDMGFSLVVADTQPFRHISTLPADKSIIMDNAVKFFQAEGQRMDFITDYEVRYLRADRRKIAQTRVALQYRYEDSGRRSAYLGEWGTDTRRLPANAPFEALGEDTAEVARLAAWVALFRLVAEQSLDFTDGRYELMTTEKAGMRTPARY